MTHPISPPLQTKAHPDEVRESAALELERLGRHRDAGRVRQCGVEFAGIRYACAVRDFCPTCGERTAHRHASDWLHATVDMQDPHLVLWAWRLLVGFDLARHLDELTRAHSAIR